MTVRGTHEGNGRVFEGWVRATLENLTRRVETVERGKDRCKMELDHDIEILHARQSKTDARVNRLEVRVAYYAGGFSLIGGIIGGIITALVAHVMG